MLPGSSGRRTPPLPYSCGIHSGDNKVEFLKALGTRQRTKINCDIRYILLWLMLSVYPLLVIPHPFYIISPAGVAPPGYFYAPRYAILVCLSLIALAVLIKDKKPLNHPALLPLLLFLTCGMTSSFLAAVPMTAWIGSPFRFTGFSTYFCCFILFILAMQNNQRASGLLKGMIYCAAVVSFLALLQYFGINLVPHEPGREATYPYGTLANPNFLGTYTAFVLPAALLFFLQHQKPPWLFCSGLIYAGLLVSLCRGAWLASLAGFLVTVYFALREQDKRSAVIRLSFVLLTVTVLLLPARDGLLLSRILTVPGEMGKAAMLEADAGSYRIFIWERVSRLFLHYWAFGIGPDHLIYAKIITPNHALVDKAHNVFLEIAVTMGTFALISYLAFLSFFFRRPRNRTGFLLLVMISVYLVQGLFNIDVVMVMPLFWIVLGLALGYLNFEDYKPQKGE
ncbi:MAG: hypothetical protein PWQ99_1206 [Clostridia bacterium]|nr:hypothetical protein [Clostridia bacterium]